MCEWRVKYLASRSQKHKTLPEAQRTQNIDQHFKWKQAVEITQDTESILWVCLALSASIELVFSSVKSEQPLVLTDRQTSDPLDRTPGIYLGPIKGCYPAWLKVEKNKSEQEEPWDAENQKHGHSLEGKGVILDSSLFWKKVWIHLLTFFLPSHSIGPGSAPSSWWNNF